MRSRFRYAFARLGERLWFGPAVYAVLASLAIGLAVGSDEIPMAFRLPDFSIETLRALLNVLATTLLGVATFAVASMVSAFASASTTATPRAFALVIADGMSRRALSVFVAAYIFSIIGLVTVHVHGLGRTGRLVLFLLIIAVIGWVVLTFVAWVDSIARLGRMSDTIGKLERATLAALRHWGADSRMGTPEGIVPAGVTEIYARAPDPDPEAAPETRVGHVQHLDLEELEAWAERNGARLWLHAMPGDFIPLHRPLASIAFDPGRAGGAAEAEEAVRRAVVIDAERSYAQDPRFGLTSLSEIASRALSPAINDAGTAIDVVRRLTRIFSVWAEIRSGRTEIVHRRVHVRPLEVETLMTDGFLSIERDGAGMVEVGVWLQHAFASLAALPDAEIAPAAAARSGEARVRAEQALTFAPDRARVARAAEAVSEAVTLRGGPKRRKGAVAPVQSR